MDLEITTAPELSLLIPSIRVTNFGDSVKDLAKNMFDYLKKYDGIGLAAPQVGYNVSVIVLDKSLKLPVGKLASSAVRYDNKNQNGYLLINPRILNLSEEKCDLIGGEGCISFPGNVSGKVRRHKEIELVYQNVDGVEVKEVLSGVPATVIQHELDHLNGILYPSRMSSEYELMDLLEKYSKKTKADKQGLFRFIEYSRENISNDFHDFGLDDLLLYAKKINLDPDRTRLIVNRIKQINGDKNDL
jgi:peptide deformylase